MWITGSTDEKGRCAAGSRCTQGKIAAHWDALCVAGLDQTSAPASVLIVLCVVPSSEEPQNRARATRGVRLLSKHGFEEGISRVLLGKENGQSAGIEGGHVRETGFQGLGPGFSSAAVAAESAFHDETGCSEMCVCAPDQPELQRIGTQILVEGEPALQGIPGEVDRFSLRFAKGRAMRIRRFFESAAFVRDAGNQCTFGFALVLHDLDEAVVSRADRSFFFRDLLAGMDSRCEGRSITPVRIVWNREGLTSGPAISALGIQPVPEMNGHRARLHYADREFGDLLVAEDDIAMQVARAFDRSRPFVADEARKGTARTPVIGSLRGPLMFFPDYACRGETMLTVLPAESPARLQKRITGVHDIERDTRKSSIHATDERIMTGLSPRLADMDLADLVRVIRDHGKVERPDELNRAKSVAIGIEGLNVEGVALRKSIGFGRGDARVLGRCVLGASGMNVGVAEEGATQGGVIAAGRPVFCDGEGTFGGIRR